MLRRHEPLQSSARVVSLVPLEKLNRSLVLLGGRERLEGAEVAPPARSRVFLARIQPILAALELANHLYLRSPLRIGPGFMG